MQVSPLKPCFVDYNNAAGNLMRLDEATLLRNTSISRRCQAIHGIIASALEFLQMLVWAQASPMYSRIGFGVCGLEQQASQRFF